MEREESAAPVMLALGEDPVEAAALWAIEEARRRHCGIHLVHVAGHGSIGPPLSPLEDVDVRRAGRLLLDEAADRLRQTEDGHDEGLDEGLHVTTHLATGSLVHALVDAAQDVSLVVLQHRALSRFRRVVTRSVTGGVAARARVPVVAVPEGWEPSPSDQPTITVGIADVEHAVRLAHAGVEAAAQRGARLRLLHAVDLPDVHLETTMTPPEFDQWARRDTELLHAQVDELADESGVVVEVQVRRGPPADHLLEATRTSDLLILGRHDSRLPLGSHLGSVARALLRETACPMLLLDAGDEGHR